jgi:hypothetical protein
MHWTASVKMMRSNIYRTLGFIPILMINFFLWRQIMSKHFKLTVTSMTCHHLYITTPDSVDQDKVYEHWRNFDGGDFSHDPDGDWEFSDLYEVDKEDIDSFHVDWEDEIDV